MTDFFVETQLTNKSAKKLIQFTYIGVFCGFENKIKLITKKWASSVHKFATQSLFPGPAAG